MNVRYTGRLTFSILAAILSFGFTSARGQDCPGTPAQLPGSPKVTASSGDPQKIPAGVQVDITLNLGVNLGGGLLLDPTTVSITIKDPNGNIIAGPIKPTPVGVGGPPPTSYSYTVTVTLPNPNTRYEVFYVFGTTAGGTQGGDVPINTKP